MIDYGYPTAFLGEAVQKNLLITDGTVTVSGDTYTVTDDTITITNSELELEAFELHQSLCSDMQLRFGSCEAASISFVFHGDTASIKGKTVKVYIIPNHEASKMLQLGVFTIYEEKKVGDAITKRQCTGYDAMYDILNADVAEWYYGLFTSSTTTKTIKQVRDSFLSNFSITPETVTLINDTVNIRRTIEADSISGADIIRGICEVNGVFGMITNEGKFRFVSLTPNVGDDATDIDTTDLISCQFESYNSKAITGVKIVFSTGASKVYGLPINRYTISGNVIVNSISDSPATLYNAGQRLYNKVKGHLYTPATITALGNPVYEVGDPIRATARGDREILTYILERRLSGIQALRDTYSAKGEEKCSAALNSSASRYTQMGNEIAQSTAQAIAKSDSNFVEIIRNIGFRLLDEPTGVSVEFDENSGTVKLTWTDPANIATSEPVSATWAGTVIVRKEGSAPLNRYDGTEIVDSTTRDAYSSTAYSDNTIQSNKEYYYGIFPYDTNGYVRYTKVVHVSVGDVYHEPDRWVTKTWNGLASFDPEYIWTDGDNIYYSNDTDHYVLDRETSTWTPKTWNGLSSFYGNQIWTDGEHIYYSAYSSSDPNYGQYVLDKATSTWTGKVWNGGQISSWNVLQGRYIWTDGENIYFGTTSVLNKATDSWEYKAWTGNNTTIRPNLWKEGEHYYYSNNSTQQVLDKATSTWSSKTWYGKTSFLGQNVWTDGVTIFYSQDGAQYTLNVETNTWVAKTWNTSYFRYPYGNKIWTDGQKIYHGSGYELQ